MTRNEAAERLRQWLPNDPNASEWNLSDLLDAALAEERSRVVAQIRERVGSLPIVSFQTMKYAEVLEALTRFMTALDAVEADRWAAPSDERPRTHAGKSLAAASPELRRQILIIEDEAASPPPAATPFPEHESRVRLYPAAPSLRAALEHLAILRGRALHGWVDDSTWDVNEIDAAAEAVRAAGRIAGRGEATRRLVPLGPAVTEGLDVERLAEASMLADDSYRIEGRIPVLHQERAKAIAREYARLSAEQPDTEATE